MEGLFHGFPHKFLEKTKNEPFSFLVCYVYFHSVF